MKKKTIDDLFEEIENAKRHSMVNCIHYFNYDPMASRTQLPNVQRLNVLSLEFKHNCDSEKVREVFEHIKNNYWSVIYDVRLVTYNRIHIYTVANVP
jgi:hypothetical protein